MIITKDQDGNFIICENLESLMARFGVLSKEMTLLLDNIKRDVNKSDRTVFRKVDKKIRDIIVYMDDIKKEIEVITNGKEED